MRILLKSENKTHVISIIVSMTLATKLLWSIFSVSYLFIAIYLRSISTHGYVMWTNMQIISGNMQIITYEINQSNGYDCFIFYVGTIWRQYQ